MKTLNVFAFCIIFFSIHFLESSSQKETVTYKDEFNRTVKIIKSPSRIISLAPNITELLYSLELKQKIVGITQDCDFPADTHQLTKIGHMGKVDIERILSLKPDLVLGTVDGNSKAQIEQLENLKIPVFIVYPKSIKDISKSILNIGKITGKSQLASVLSRQFNDKLSLLTSKIDKKKNPTVYIQINEDPMISASRGTFLDDLITLAGGINIMKDSKIRYPHISKETLLKKNPDVIVVAMKKIDHARFPEIVKKWQNYNTLSSVKNKKIAVIDADIISRASLRITEGLETLIQIFYPKPEIEVKPDGTL